MAVAGSGATLASDRLAQARLHALLRFSTGVTMGFILAEAMGWAPTFLVPVLAAVLLTSLPFSPPLKVGMAVVAAMAAAASLSFLLSALLRGSPAMLVGAIALVVFPALATMARGRAKLPATLLLLCISSIPVVAMIAPAQAGYFAIALTRAAAVAMLIVWSMHGLWPEVMPPAAPPPGPLIASPARTALAGTAIVMPVMLVHLLYGLANALPVVIATVLLVTHFDPREGAMQGLRMMLGNLFGGFVGVAAFLLLGAMPSLATLAALTFLFATAFAIRIEKGGSAGATALLACNAALIILSTAIASPSTSSGVWMTRLLQFALACTFASSMMVLFWGGRRARESASA
jgi:hypothetical protein